MLELLKAIWSKVTHLLFPKDIFSWQTFMYLGLFSLAMAWVARSSGTLNITESLIATLGWGFFAFGIGWLLEQNQVRVLGLSLAPWVAGAILCIYFLNLIPWVNGPGALMSWPLVSVIILAAPYFLTWELKPRIPSPPARQQLILVLLIALLFSSWFQFYFRLQTWFGDYPSLLADSFDNSGFVYRYTSQARDQAQGVSLLTTVEADVKAELNDTPWPYVERWLLNLNEQLVTLQSESIRTLEQSLADEKGLWQLEARPRSLNDGYALELFAVWSGPASDPKGYHLQKTCLIQPRSPAPQPTTTPNDRNDAASPPTQMAEVTCDLKTPKHSGKPITTTS